VTSDSGFGRIDNLDVENHRETYGQRNP
jgi:hypothetical protein